jgi:hypothetical protein
MISIGRVGSQAADTAALSIIAAPNDTKPAFLIALPPVGARVFAASLSS